MFCTCHDHHAQDGDVEGSLTAALESVRCDPSDLFAHTLVVSAAGSLRRYALTLLLHMHAYAS